MIGNRKTEKKQQTLPVRSESFAGVKSGMFATKKHAMMIIIFAIK